MTPRLNKSPWRDPPLTGTPLDYAPIDAPVAKHIVPTRWKAPNPLKRASVAAVSAGCTIGLVLLFPFVLVAVPVLLASWWLLCRLYSE